MIAEGTRVDGHVVRQGAWQQLPDAELVAELRREVDQLHEALLTRQNLGEVSGMLAERHGLSLEEAWALLVRASQHTNLKVREVAWLVTAARSGELTGLNLAKSERVSTALATGLEVLGRRAD